MHITLILNQQAFRMRIQRFFFAKTRLSDTAHTWYDSQDYDEILVTFVTFKSHILDYFIPFDYVRRVKRALVACKMG